MPRRSGLQDFNFNVPFPSSESQRMLGSTEGSLPPGSLPGPLPKSGPLPPHVDAAVTPHGTLCAPGQQHWPHGARLWAGAAAGLQVHMLLGTQLATRPRVRGTGEGAGQV